MAFLVCSKFCVYGVVQKHLYSVPHYLTGRYVSTWRIAFCFLFKYAINAFDRGKYVADQKELNRLSSPIGMQPKQTEQIDSRNWNKVFIDTSKVIVIV